MVAPGPVPLSPVCFVILQLPRIKKNDCFSMRGKPHHFSGFAG
jgi:hypothetical protein